jgi:hypothetical protein
MRAVTVNLGKLVLLLVLTYAFFIAYTYSAPFLQRVMAEVPGRSLTAVLAVAAVQALVLALGWAAVFALPLAWGFGRLAHLAGVACVSPVLVLMIAASSSRSPTTIGVVCFSALCLVLFVPLAAKSAHRVLQQRPSKEAGVGA